jgi:hypothetical protein
MNHTIAQPFENTTPSKSGGAARKTNRGASRMKLCWRIIRARRRSAAARNTNLGSYYSSDRNQMSIYVG